MYTYCHRLYFKFSFSSVIVHVSCYIIMNMSVKLLFTFLFVSVFNDVQAAKILAVFPMPSISHQVVFRKLTQELARRGHELTVITTDPVYREQEAPANYKEIDIHDMSYQILQKYYQSTYKVDQDHSVSVIKQMFSFLITIFEAQMQSPKIKDLISNKTNSFDLIFIEAISTPSLAFSHLFKAPVILISSMGASFTEHHIFGSSSHPLLYPMPFNRKIYNLTIWEKIEELYTHFSYKYIFSMGEDSENEIIQKVLGSDIPPLSELRNNVDMLFLNMHWMWADNQPVPPSVLYMGGLHQIPQKELPQDLKRFLDSSKNGVIYLSFGTNVLPEMIPQDKIDTMVKVLSGLPYDVLWKWNQDELPGKADNIRISKWYPQSDLLRHPNIKLFITQAGLQSTDEAILAGVPLVAVPMLADQWYNAEKYVHRGIGIKVDIKTLSIDVFKNAIETVIKNDSYRKNIIKLRELLNDSPQSPLERAVWWTEYVIRHKGAKQLRPPTANISFFEYYEVKLVLIILSTVVCVLFVVVKLTAYIFKFLYNFLSSKNKIKTN